MPDFTERRIAYHSDGTMVFVHRSADNGNDVLELEETAKAALNSELDAGVYFTSDVWSWIPTSPVPDWLVFFFPLPMNLKGIYNGLWHHISGQMNNGSAFPAGTPTPGTFELNPMGYPALFEYSEDSTNGYDGTWQSLGVLLPSSNSWPDDGRDGWLDEFYQRIGNRSFSANLVPTMKQPRTYYWAVQGLVSRLSTSLFPEYGSVVQDYFPDNVRTLSHDYDPVAREGVHPINARRVRALRVSLTATGIPSTWLRQNNDGMMAFIGLFGEPEQVDDDRIELRNRDNDSVLDPTAFAWGDLVPSDSEDRAFRVKNSSGKRTAYRIRVTAIDTVVSVFPASQLLLFSKDEGMTWEPEVEIGSLGPGAVSRTILVRIISQENWPSGYQSVWINADAEEWR